MQRFKVAIIFCALAVILGGFRPAWAVTYAYIPSYANNSVVRIDTSAQTFTSVTFPDDGAENACSAYGAAVAPDGSFVVITCTDEDAVTALTDASFESGTASPTAPVGDQPRGVAIDPNGAYAYVANFGADTVSIIDIATTTVTETVDVGAGPWGVAAIQEESETRIKVYVTNSQASSVSVLIHDGADITSQTIANVGINPIGIAATPDGQYVYVANYTEGGEGTVAVIRTNDDTIVGRIPAGRGPWGVAVGAKGAYAYVTNSDLNSNSVTVIRTADYAALGTLNAGLLPQGVAAPKNGDFAYVINQEGNDPISHIEVNATASTATVASIAQDDTHPIEGAFALGVFIGGAPPTAPSGLTSAPDSNDIALTWEDNSADELGFKIERRKVGDTAYQEIADADADATAYTDISVVGGNSYEYRIRAFNEAADSDYTTASAEVTASSDDFSWCFIGTLLN